MTIVGIASMAEYSLEKIEGKQIRKNSININTCDRPHLQREMFPDLLVDIPTRSFGAWLTVPWRLFLPR